MSLAQPCKVSSLPVRVIHCTRYRCDLPKYTRNPMSRVAPAPESQGSWYTCLLRHLPLHLLALDCTGFVLLSPFSHFS